MKVLRDDREVCKTGGSSALSLAITIALCAITLCGCKGKRERVQTAAEKAEDLDEATLTPIPRTNDPVQIKQARLEWNARTLKGDYDRVGRRNAKWDAAVHQGLAEVARFRTVGITSPEGSPQRAGQFFTQAVTNGCDDPLVNYFYLRFAATFEGNNKMKDAYVSMSEQLEGSEYHPIRKFYGSLRTGQALHLARAEWKQEYRFRKAAADYLARVVGDISTPIGEVYEACDQLMEANDDSPELVERFFKQYEPDLLTNWPDEPETLILKGRCALAEAWEARGTASAGATSSQQWKAFREGLKTAEAALHRAWRLDPSNRQIPRLMIELEQGQGRGRQRMELWFSRAMELDTNNYRACWAKLNYLQPRWFGSPRDLLAFGRECVASARWGGDVPLTLADAHEVILYDYEENQKPAYWKNPAVWKDIKAAFEKFYLINPPETEGHQRFARYAAWCEQWEEFNRQVKLCSPVDYDFFGGKGQFEKYQEAARKAGVGP